MKINIFSDDAATAFDDAQKRARVRMVSIDEARASVAQLEKQLKSHGIPKRLWCGMEATFSPWSRSFPASYKGRPEGTYYCITRGSSKWYLTGVGRSYVDESTNNAVAVKWSGNQARYDVGEYLHRAFVRGLA